MNAESPTIADRRAVFYFLIVSFATTWMVWAGLWLFRVRPTETLKFAILGTMPMYLPGISALLVRRFVRGEHLRDTTLLRIGKKKFYWLAWLLFPILIVVTMLLDLATGAARLDRTFSQLVMLASAAGKTPPPDPSRFAVGQLLTALALGPPMHALTTIGEELGWRDFLLPSLIRSGLSQWSALITTGAIWGLWHIPVILLGLEYATHPFLGIPAFIGYTILVGIIIGWLQLASGSVWVSALAHGSINAVQRAALIFIVGYNGLISGGLGSLIGWIPLTVYIGWLAATGRIPSRDNGEAHKL